LNWILFGFKGAGKTYFGRLLAQRTNLSFLDTDELIEKREKMSCRHISLERGELHFRSLEKELITNLDVKDHIISLGGGSILDRENRIYLQKLGQLIYLKCPKDLLKKRMLIPPLPSFIDPSDPEGSFETMYCTRKPQYEIIPSRAIHLAKKTDQEILEELWQVINSVISFA